MSEVTRSGPSLHRSLSDAKTSDSLRPLVEHVGGRRCDVEGKRDSCGGVGVRLRKSPEPLSEVYRLDRKGVS